MRSSLFSRPASPIPAPSISNGAVTSSTTRTRLLSPSSRAHSLPPACSIPSLQRRSVGFKCLREDAQDVLALTLEVARTPAFPEERLEILRTQALEAIAHRNDSASGIPARELRKLLYGPLSPYAKQPTRATVKSISREDIQAFHDKWQRPDAAYLGIGEAARRLRPSLQQG